MHTQDRENEKKKLVNRTSELYFRDKLSLPRKFFQTRHGC